MGGYSGDGGWVSYDNNPAAATNLTPSSGAYSNDLAYQTPTSAAGYSQNPSTVTQGSTGSTLTQPDYLGAPATYSGSTINTAQFDPSTVISLLNQSMVQPNQTATNNLNQTLAALGVTGGDAINLASQLQNNLSSAQAGVDASAIQAAQNNVLSADTTNVNSTNAANSANANATNATNAANVGEYNTNEQNLLNDLMNQYYAQLGAFNSINSSGQSAGNQAAVNYGNTITTSDPFAQIFGGLTSAASAAAPYLAAGG